MNQPTLQVIRVQNEEQRKIAMAIRYKVFIEEQGFDASVELDAHDDEPTTVHFIGKYTGDDKYVAVGRCLLKPEERKAKFGRIAVLPSYRGKQLGAALMDGIEKSLQNEVDTFALSSQYGRRGFYEKCGYRYLDDKVYLEEGVEHCMMIKDAQSQ